MRHLLRDIAEIGAGQGAPQGDLNYCNNGTPFIKAGNMENLSSGGSLDAIQKVSEEVAKAHNLKLYPKGTVLFAKSGMSCLKGYIYVLPRETYVVSHLACITPHEDISEYLRYYFEYHKPNQLVKDPAYPSISLADIGALEIDIKNAEKRANIISKLNSAKSIIGLRKQEIQRFDELIKARFVEMFGTPFVNEKRWVVSPIRDVVTEVRYGTSRPAVEDGKYPYLRMNNLTTDGSIDLNNLKRIDIPDDEIEKCIVRKGDVLFNRTNSVELVGKTAMFDLDEEMVIAGYIIRVRLKPVLLPEVFAQYMNLKQVKDLLRTIAKGAVNQANINAQELQGIQVYVPSIELQKEFVSFKKQIDKSKFVVQQALDKAQLLFDSLMQKYFG